MFAPLSRFRLSSRWACVMREFTEYFRRIQGRLVLAFGIVITGTIVIWWFGMMSMSQLTDEIGLRMDQLHRSLDLGSQLEATVLNQMVPPRRGPGTRYWSAVCGKAHHSKAPAELPRRLPAGLITPSTSL